MWSILESRDALALDSNRLTIFVEVRKSSQWECACALAILHADHG